MAKWIGVSTTKHQLTLYEDNSLIKTYPIATGKILTQTPFGTFTIINKQSNPGGPLESCGWDYQDHTMEFMVQIILPRFEKACLTAVFGCTIMTL